MTDHLKLQTSKMTWPNKLLLWVLKFVLLPSLTPESLMLYGTLFFFKAVKVPLRFLTCFSGDGG